MKNALGKFLAAAAVIGAAGAMLAATAVDAREKDPVFEMRRTLTMAFGQHRITLEAPLGMCFLDESQYIESMLVKQFRSLGESADSGIVMAMFADCDEIAKFIRLPELTDETLPGMEPPTAELTYRGTVAWLKPRLGRSPLSLQDYLDMREPDFRDDLLHSIAASYRQTGGNQEIKVAGNITTRVIMGPPDQFQVDAQPRRTDTGLFIGYSTEFEAEYQKHRMAGVVGTTLLRNFPVQVSLVSSASGGKKGRSLNKMRRAVDELMAQISKLNP